jgi:phage shock protein A
MIISKKKLNEKVCEALERAERERWLHDKIDRVERECNERIDGLHRHIMDLEKQIIELKQKHGG